MMATGLLGRANVCTMYHVDLIIPRSKYHSMIRTVSFSGMIFVDFGV